MGGLERAGVVGAEEALAGGVETRRVPLSPLGTLYFSSDLVEASSGESFRKLLQKAELERADVPDRPVHMRTAYVWRAWLFAWRQEVSLAIESHIGVSFFPPWREGVPAVQVRRRGAGKTKYWAALRRSSALIPSPGSTRTNYIVILGMRLLYHTCSGKSRGKFVEIGVEPQKNVQPLTGTKSQSSVAGNILSIQQRPRP